MLTSGLPSSDRTIFTALKTKLPVQAFTHNIKDLLHALRGSLRVVIAAVIKQVDASPQNLNETQLKILREVLQKLENLRTLNNRLFGLVIAVLDKAKAEGGSPSSKIPQQQELEIKHIVHECNKFCELVEAVYSELKKNSDHLQVDSLFVEGINICRKDLLAVIKPVLRPEEVADGMSELDPAQAAKEVVTIHTADAAEKKLEMKLNPPPDIHKLAMNTHDFNSLFRSIIGTLLINAIQYTDHGSIIVGLKVLEQTVAELTLDVSVTDTGKGIATEALPRIGELYYRTSSPKAGGFGVGVAMAKRSVEKDLKGTFYTRSELGKGSVFGFTFTAKRCVADIEAIDSAKRRPPSPPKDKVIYPELRGRKILIAEDNLTNQKLIKHMLEAEGAICKIVTNGAEAVAECQECQDFKPDIILMDLNMPVMNGSEAARQIRGLKGGISKIPIIGLSAEAIPEPDALVHMSAYLKKPYNRKNLCEILVKTLAQPVKAALADAKSPEPVAESPPPVSTAWCGFHAPKPQPPVAAPSKEVASSELLTVTVRG